MDTPNGVADAFGVATVVVANGKGTDACLWEIIIGAYLFAFGSYLIFY
jgi:hypothetical protein